jgi:hypothetical protein
VETDEKTVVPAADVRRLRIPDRQQGGLRIGFAFKKV